MDIYAIPPGDLRHVWPEVKAGLDKMPAEDWIAEDVYHAIKSGQASLHIGANPGFAGFLVLEKRITQYSKLPTLHVWLAYNAGDADVFTAGLEMVRATARKVGASKITFGSPRPGWQKRFPLVTATYEIPIEESH